MGGGGVRQGKRKSNIIHLMKHCCIIELSLQSLQKGNVHHFSLFYNNFAPAPRQP